VKRKILLFLSIFFLVTGCYKSHLYVQIENIGKDFLASSYVKTPDYRQQNPPTGQRIIVNWCFPKELYSKDLFIKLTVRFWSNTQVTKNHAILKLFGSKSFFFPSDKKEDRILTYRIEVFSKEGNLIETWKHQFWTDLIDVDKEDEPIGIH
jgi:hypothetical protein